MTITFVLAACSDASKSTHTTPPQNEVPSDDDTGSPMKKTMQPTDIKFKRGPALTPSDKLTSYLASLHTIDGKPLLVRLPVAITLDPTGFGIDKATVGELAVKLNDGALGISLVDRLRNLCPPDASTCAVWLQGHWRPPNGFDLRKVGKAIPDIAAVDYCEVQDL